MNRKQLSRRAFSGLVGMPPEPEVKISCSHADCDNFILVSSASPDATFTCATHNPGKSARAKAAKDVPDEVKAWAKESSAAPANTRPITSLADKEDVIEVETSDGLRTVETSHVEENTDPILDDEDEDEPEETPENKETETSEGRGETLDADDLLEDEAAPETAPDAVDVVDAADAVPAAPVAAPFFTPEPTRIPNFLKTVPSPVVRTNNPAAPYGYDENDRPIGIYVGKPYVRPELTAIVETPTGPCKCDSPLCKHCHPENIVQTEVIKPHVPVVMTDEEKLADALTQARTLLGIVPKVHPVKKPAVWFTEVLDITRQQLLDLLNAEVGKETREVSGGTAQLRQPTDEKAQLAARTSALNHITGRIQEMKDAIKESEELIASLSIRIMKHGTKTLAPRAADDELFSDKSRREQLKRDERKAIEKYEETLSGLRKQEKIIKDEISKLQERLETWGSRPDDYERVATQIKVSVTFRERFKEPADEIKDTSLPYSELKLRNVLMTDAYISLLSTEYEGLRMLSRAHSLLRPWRKFENEVIRQAVSFGLIHPTEEQLQAHPSLKRPPGEDDETETDYSGEEALIAKTGGAAIGASIYGYGGNRQSGSFDNTIAYGNKDKGGDGNGNDSRSGTWSSDIDSGDHGEDPVSD